MDGPHSPLLIILSGPSGAGKDTVIERLREQRPAMHYVVTVTTRAPRPGEIPGKSYIFVSQEEYDTMRDRGELLAPADVHGHWYGAPVDQIRRALARGQDVLLKVDVQGARQVRRRIPQAVYVFLAPPTFEELSERMRHRHTESPADLERRLRDARYEMEQMPQYDYLVINRRDELDRAVGNLACIIEAERLRIHRPRVAL